MAEATGSPDWQTTKRTILERNKYMFGNSLMSDILFVFKSKSTGKTVHRKTFPAHKYVLSTASPVFFAMFYGELKEENELQITDASPRAFREFLRFLYTDETFSESDGDSVLEVLYLAKKYIVPCVVDKCSQFLEKNINKKDALVILEQGIKYDEERIVKMCWEFIELNVETIATTQEFLALPPELLCALLQRESINIEEIDILRAVDKWAIEQCKLKQLSCDGKNKRDVLGEALSLIRFDNIEQEVFITKVLEMDILTLEEVKRIELSWYKRENVMSCKRNDWRCSRFTSLDPQRKSYSDCNPDKIQFKTDKPILFRGVQLYGSKGNRYTVQLAIYCSSNRDLKPLVTIKGNYISEDCGEDCRFNVFLDSPLKLAADRWHIIEAKIEGRDSYCGSGGLSKVSKGGVTFAFTNAPRGRTNVLCGQIPAIIFRHVQEKSLWDFIFSKIR